MKFGLQDVNFRATAGRSQYISFSVPRFNFFLTFFHLTTYHGKILYNTGCFDNDM